MGSGLFAFLPTAIVSPCYFPFPKFSAKTSKTMNFCLVVLPVVCFFFLGGYMLYIRTHLQIIKFPKPPQIHCIFQHILLKLLFFKTCGMAVKHRMFVARSWRSSTLQHHLWITRSVGSLLWKSTWNQRMFQILMELILWYQEFWNTILMEWIPTGATNSYIWYRWWWLNPAFTSWGW